MYVFACKFKFSCLSMWLHVCGCTSCTSESMFRILRGLMRTLTIWRSVGGRMLLFVSARCHKSVLTWCVFEVKLWNSDMWACVVSCGETWISPVCLWPNWLLRNHCDCSWTLAWHWHEQVTVSFTSCVSCMGCNHKISIPRKCDIIFDTTMFWNKLFYHWGKSSLCVIMK